MSAPKRGRGPKTGQHETSWIGNLLDLEVLGTRPFQKMVDAGYFVLDNLRPALGCESCGKPVPWWGKPVEWIVKAFSALTGAKKPQTQAPPSEA